MPTTLFPPDELPQPPFDWPVPLLGLDGSPERLSGIKVWYDFDWKVEFQHTRRYRGFPNSSQLTALVKAAAPEGKTPQLLLTKVTTYSQDVIETDKEFVLVVNIDEFKKVTPDKAMSLFARKLGGSVVTLADVRAFVETEDGRTELLSLIQKPILRDWLREGPQRVEEFLEVLSEVQAFELSVDVKQRLLDLCLRAEPDTLAKIAQCLTSAEPAKILAAFERLDLASLESLNTAANLGALKATLAEWEQNKTCKDEVGFWQTFFQRRPYILSQLFSYPIVIMEGSAFLGGTGTNRKGSKLVDFLVKNKLTKNTAIIEIKTPMTPLVRNTAYRPNSVFAIHAEVTGAIVQAATYKSTFLTHYADLREDARINGSDADFEVFDPPLFVIAGSLSSLNVLVKRRSFELFRNGLSNVQLVTFDELFERIQGLISLLESGWNSADSDSQDSEAPEVTDMQGNPVRQDGQDCPSDERISVVAEGKQHSAEGLEPGRVLSGTEKLPTSLPFDAASDHCA